MAEQIVDLAVPGAYWRRLAAVAADCVFLSGRLVVWPLRSPHALSALSNSSSAFKHTHDTDEGVQGRLTLPAAPASGGRHR